MRRPHLVTLGLAILYLVSTSGSQVFATPLAPAVECWIENQTPSVPVGGWASYVVHASGGYGTYAVTLSYGDGAQESGTYSATAIGFQHIFWSSGAYYQTASVSGAGSVAQCSTSTSVY